MALALVFFQVRLLNVMALTSRLMFHRMSLNIQSESTVVTVHTDIAYSLVVGASVYSQRCCNRLVEI